MGKLTDDVSRLHEEIIALRNARKSLMADLASGASRLSSAVSGLRAEFKNKTGEVCGSARDSRLAFTSGLKNSVNAARQQMNSDLAGARRAWFGPSSAERLAEERRKHAAAENKRLQDERKRREEARHGMEAEQPRETHQTHHKAATEKKHSAGQMNLGSHHPHDKKGKK